MDRGPKPPPPNACDTSISLARYGDARALWRVATLRRTAYLSGGIGRSGIAATEADNVEIGATEVRSRWIYHRAPVFLWEALRSP